MVASSVPLLRDGGLLPPCHVIFCFWHAGIWEGPFERESSHLYPYVVEVLTERLAGFAWPDLKGDARKTPRIQHVCVWKRLSFALSLLGRGLLGSQALFLPTFVITGPRL